MKNVEDVVYVVTDNNINIRDSWDVSKKDFDTVLSRIEGEYPDNAVLVNRSRKSLKREWASHNFLYDIGLWRSHTENVDLNYPQKWYISFAYWVFGAIAMIFIS